MRQQWWLIDWSAALGFDLADLASHCWSISSSVAIWLAQSLLAVSRWCPPSSCHAHSLFFLNPKLFWREPSHLRMMNANVLTEFVRFWPLQLLEMMFFLRSSLWSWSAPMCRGGSWMLDFRCLKKHGNEFSVAKQVLHHSLQHPWRCCLIA